MGDTQPPAAHYRVQSGDTSFYAELLTSLEGGEVKRGGRRDVTARVSGVSVQKLRHLELMFQNPWDVTISPAVGYPIGRHHELMPGTVAALAFNDAVLAPIPFGSGPQLLVPDPGSRSSILGPTVAERSRNLLDYCQLQY